MVQPSDTFDPFVELSERERLIAAKWAQGLTYREIAELLFIAPSTVRTHLATIYKKLGVGNKAALIALLSQGEPPQHVIEEVGQVSEIAGQRALHQRPEERSFVAQRTQHLWMGLAMVLLVVMGAALFVWTQGQPAAVQNPNKQAAHQAEALAAVQTEQARLVLPLPAEPSIAVLPFMNLSDDAEQDYFVDGITHDIITDLSQFSTLFVIAANSTFRYKGKPVKVQQVAEELGVRYVLEGSVQRLGDTLRINAQLSDAISGRHVWAERYDRKAKDLFIIQNEITRKIVGVISPIAQGRGKLLQAELDRVARTPIENLQAYDYFLQAMAAIERWNKVDNERSKQLFKQAIALDPNFGRAYGKHAWNYLMEYKSGWGDDPKASLQQALTIAEQGVAADPNEGWTHYGLASVYLFQKRHDLALQEIGKAHKLNPNDADITIDYGWFLTWAGRPDDGLPYIEKAMRLNPYHPSFYWTVVWLADFVAGRYQDALASLLKISDPYPNVYRLLAATYAVLGRMQEAQAAMAKYLELEPQNTIEQAAAALPFKRPEDRQRFLDGLRKAGMPEKALSQQSSL